MRLRYDPGMPDLDLLFPVPVSELTSALLVGGVCAALLLRARRGEQHVVRLSVLMVVAGLLVMMGGAVLSTHLAAPLLGTGLREVGVLLFGVGILRVIGQTLFQFVLVPFGMPRIVEDIAVIGGYLAWSLARLYHAGIPVSQLLTTSAVVTAVLAFSLQDTLGNLLGGLALELDDAFSLGDWIKVDDVAGRIVEIRWRSTSVETRNGETVVIPNSVLIRSRIFVVGKRTDQPLQWRRWIWFHVDFEQDPAVVIRVTEQAIRNAGIPFVSTDPAATCLFMDFDQSSARFALRYWLQRFDLDDTTDSLVRCQLFEALRAAGISPAVPRQRVALEGESGSGRAGQDPAADITP